ncbi:YxiJ family protein [Cytobacillus praedii]|uniref:YxiJ family protein n=1 Tax=Cytobacillus praedii TaxID=1742358 RepID=UPI003F818667
MNKKTKRIQTQLLVQAENVYMNAPRLYLAYFYEYTLKMVAREKMPNILKQVLQLDLLKSFPYSETSKLHADFKGHFLETDCINGDLNTYWMAISGSLSYILRGYPQKVPQGQIEWLGRSFFDRFKQYRFLEPHIHNYPFFYEEYSNHEKARIIILCYLFILAK